MYRHRILEKKLKEYLSFFSVVSLTGPRQSGKSTLLLHTLKNYQYVSFDSQLTLTQFYDDPEKFMRIYHNKIIFDEAQLAPEIFSYIKIAVDNDRNKSGKFILTGSAQFALMEKIKESLAGRIGLLSLLPYQFTELPQRAYNDAVYRGSYPELVNKSYKLEQDWYAAYFQTYLQKDIRAIGNVGDIRDFQKLIHLLAANTAQELSLSRFANDLGVAVKTVKRWISILETSYIIFLLPPFYKNYGKQIIKRPKIYFYDTGLVSYLTGITSKTQYEQGPMAGPIFENYIIAEIYKRELHLGTHAELFYLRTNHGVEIDLIIDRKQTKELIEIKKTETFRPKMTKAIESFLEPKDQGYLIYTGKTFPHLPEIHIINFKEYLTD